MRKNRIRLSESQLHKVIKNSVKKVLREGFQQADNGSDDWYIDYEGAKYMDLNDLKEIRSELQRCESSFLEVSDKIENYITMEKKDSRIETPDQSHLYRMYKDIEKILYSIRDMQYEFGGHYQALRSAPID